MLESRHPLLAFIFYRCISPGAVALNVHDKKTAIHKLTHGYGSFAKAN